MRIVGSMFLMLIVFGCDLLADPIEEAERRVDVFHMDYNSGNFDDIYSSAREEFRGQIDLKAMSSDLGAVIESTFVQGSAAQGCSGTTVQIVTHTDFIRGQTHERFIFVFERGDYRLVDYRHITEDQASIGVNGSFRLE